MHFFEKLKRIFLKEKSINNYIYFKNSTTKHSMTSCATLKLSAETEKKKKEIDEKLKILVKKYINSPEKLIQCIKLEGINVYKFKNADKFLLYLGEEEGFLTPLKGFKALIINLVIGIIDGKRLNFKFKTKEMFIFNSVETEIYTIARAMHKYYGYKNNLPGFDYKSQEIFKKVYQRNKKNKNFSSPFAGYSIDDMYSCKEAIARDLESINFTIELSVEYERAKKVLKQINETNSVNI